MNNISAAITAVGGYVPDYILTNEELETMVDTSDEWIQTRTGIRERHILKGEGKGASDLGVPAVQNLLEKRGIGAEEIDLLICCTATPDMLFPATANIISEKVGAKNAWSFDMMAACSGFLFALHTAAQFIETGTHKKVVVVGADKMSSIVDYTDRTTCVLFGDGAGAVLLEPNTEGLGLIDSSLHTDGSGAKYLCLKGGGSAYPASQQTLEEDAHFIYQEGRTVFKFAVTKMAEAAYEIMKRNKLTKENVAWLVPHQANKRIIDATAKRMGISEDKVMLNIDHFGNTTTATIPLCLWEWEKKLKKGDNLVLAAFGGGFTWGAEYLKWAYDAE